MKLKSISDGTLNALAILTPAEYSTLMSLSAVWAKNLKTLTISAPTPTPGVVLFREPPKNLLLLKEILLKMKDDLSAKDLLGEMRLVGFSEP
jgi:hypothetical protein